MDKSSNTKKLWWTSIKRSGRLVLGILWILSTPGKALAIDALTINVSELDGLNGFVILDIDNIDEFGWPVGHAGDINSDGISDIVVGGPDVDFLSSNRPGGAFVFFGSPGPFSSAFDPLALDGNNGFALVGRASNDDAGFAVSYAGDINNDGSDDLLIGARSADPNGNSRAGAAYAYFGGGASYPATIELSDLDGTDGFTMEGLIAVGRLGQAVASVGDINGDGIEDFVVSAPNDNRNGGDFGEGAAYIVFGSAAPRPALFDLGSLDGTNGFALLGSDILDRLGVSVAAAGDINQDGVQDVVVGAPGSGAANAGKAYVVFGSTDDFANTIIAESLDGSAGIVVAGAGDGDFAGTVTALDLNGDSLTDIVVGAPLASPQGRSGAGSTYVIFGDLNGLTENVDLADIDGTNGLVIHGISENDQSGVSLDSVGDFNGDGLDDLIISAPLADPNSLSDAGQAYIIFGSATGFPAEIYLDALTCSEGIIIDGSIAQRRLGRSVSTAGDFNNDGLSDVIIGSGFFQNFPDPTNNLGEAYVVFGRGQDSDCDGVADSQDNCLFAMNADLRDSNQDGFGNVCDGDLNNDCTVNAQDLGILKSVFFSDDSDADLNGDGIVNVVDLGVFRTLFFAPPGPSGLTNQCP